MDTVTDLLDKLWQGMQAGAITAALPETRVDDGQTLQLALLQKWLDTGETLGGYKIGLTSGAARNMFGEGIRPFGFILSSRIHQSGDTLDRSSVGALGLENELVFRVAEDIASDSADSQLARSVVDGVAPGFEINQIRLKTGASQGIRIAENLTQWGIVAGHFIGPDQNFDDLTVSLTKGGETVQKTAASGHIDNHFESIAALINRLHQFGLGLKKGQLLITGSYTRQTVNAPGKWVGDFEGIGKVEVTVT